MDEGNASYIQAQTLLNGSDSGESLVKAAEAMRLAAMMMTGAGGAQDFDSALAWWARGADLGDSRCALNLGIAHAGGHAGDVNFVAAWYWFKMAERLGNDGAAAELERLEGVMSEDEHAAVVACTAR